MKRIEVKIYFRSKKRLSDSPGSSSRCYAQDLERPHPIHIKYYARARTPSSLLFVRLFENTGPPPLGLPQSERRIDHYKPAFNR